MVLLSKLYAMLCFVDLRCRCLYYIIHRLAGVHISGMQCINFGVVAVEKSITTINMMENTM